MDLKNLVAQASFNADNPVFKPIDDHENYRRVLICLKKGQILSNHKSPVDYSMQSISGKTLFYEGQVTHELTPGWITNIEKNLMHKIEAAEDSVLLMTQIPNPKKK